MAKKASWTVMVYLAGDNNLTTECMFALTEMKKVALNENVNVIAQFDPSDPYLPSHRYEINSSRKKKDLYADITDCARYIKSRGEVNFRKESRQANLLAERRRKARKKGNPALDKASLTETKTSTVITDDTDTGSPVTLYNFISYCIQEYEADHYMVVLSGHAGGTERDYLLKDESSARSLTFNELQQVFKKIKQDRKGKLIDIIGMDNCLMSMAEICYELRGLTEIVVGCESFSPTSGWPYRQILQRLCNDFATPEAAKKPSVTTEAAKAIVEEYVNYYATYWMAGLSVTQSALNVKKVGELRREIGRLAQAMEKALLAEADQPRSSKQFENALLLAHWEAQSYNGEQFVDLYDLCDCLQKRLSDSDRAIVDLCNRVKKFIATEFVLTSCYCGATYQYSYGVSIYFPWAQVAPNYWNLDFVSETSAPGWGSFLKTYTKLTRRLPRGVERASLDQRIQKEADTSADRQGSGDHRMGYDRMVAGSGGMDRMVADRMMADRMMVDRMMADRMGTRNRVHSMRNPPNIFYPDDCVKEGQRAWDCQKYLRLR